MPDDSLDLSGLDLAPDWVKEIKSPPTDFPSFKEDRRGGGGGDGPRRPKGKRPRRDDRGDRRSDGRGDRRSDGPRRGGPRKDAGPGRGRGPRRDGKGGGGPRGDRNRDRGRGRDGRGGRDQRDNRKPQAPPIEGFKVKLTPLDPGVQYLVQQIRMTGRAYPIFDLAKLLLESRERYTITVKRENESSPQLFRCAADGSLWLSREEATRHLLNSKAIGEYYEIETIEGEPPKGNFKSVAVCGMSGKLLGPPNHHGYQPELNRLYRERFSHMDFERFKSRIKMSQEEETIEKWKEQESTTTHYKPKGEEEMVLKDRTALEQHFRDHHAGTIEEVENGTISGDAASKRMLAGPLSGLVRSESDAQRRFPLDVMQFLCRKFEEAGLKFFKKGKKRTFVTLSRPRQIPADVSFSEGIHRIVDFVRYNPGTTLNKLAGMLIPKEERSASVESKALAEKKDEAKTEEPPTTEETVAKESEETSAPAEEAAARTPEAMEAKPEESVEAVNESEVTDSAETSVSPETEAEPADGSPSDEATVAKEESPDPEPAAAAPTEAPAPPALSDAEVAVLQDLRWLVREGYVIEFNDGKLFLPEERQDPPKKKKAKKKKAESIDKKKDEAKPKAEGDTTAEPEKEHPAEDVWTSENDSKTTDEAGENEQKPTEEPVAERSEPESPTASQEESNSSSVVELSEQVPASGETEEVDSVAADSANEAPAQPVSEESSAPPPDTDEEIDDPKEESSDPVPVG
ncbi:MAG: hypothetical protein AAGA58_12350 [Verrucomicrobiota bacterium]